MPSDLVVPVAVVDRLKPHPNADKLEIAEILGWQTCVGKGYVQEGDKVIYVPPDAMVPEEVADLWGVADYLGSNGRVKQIRLRGEPSFGFIVKHNGYFNEGQNVADDFGITKYEPPRRQPDGWKPGKGKRGHSLAELTGFPQYTRIPNLRHFPKSLEEGEEVWVTEKIHGTNSRIGVVCGTRCAGSHRVRRHPPWSNDLWTRLKRWFAWTFDLGDPNPTVYDQQLYWFPWSLPGVQIMLRDLAKRHQRVVLYGEIFGADLQSLDYGIPRRKRGYRVFDLKLDGQYVDLEELDELCLKYDVPMVPVMGLFEYSLERVAEESKGSSLIFDADHMREGVVVRPRVERNNPRHGRVIFKYLSDDYLLSKQTDFAEE